MPFDPRSASNRGPADGVMFNGCIVYSKRRFEEAEQAFAAGASAAVDKRLSGLMANAMSVEEVVAKPELTRTEAFDNLY